MSFYLDILTKLELPIFIFGILGIFSSIIERKPLKRFLSYYCILTIAIYFYMPYKMPNMIPNIVLPLALTSGIGVDVIVKRIKRLKKRQYKKYRKYCSIFFSSILIISISFLLYTSILANFVNYANEEKNKLVFVQTTDDIKRLLKDVEQYSLEKTGGKLIDIDISIPQTEYPLSWYWHDYPNIRFYNKKVNVPENWKGFNWEGDAIITWTSFEKKSGEKSMKISAINGSNANFWQKISLKGGKWYEFEGWIKTENIEKVGIVEKVAQIHIRKDKNDAPAEIISESKPLLGTTDDWRKVNLEFFLPKNENFIWISCVLANWGKARGTIWFDDLVLKEKDNPFARNLIPNGNFELGNKLEDFNARIIVVSENDGQVLEGRKDYKMKRYILRPTVNLAVYFKEDFIFS
jgi:hypothetical protein